MAQTERPTGRASVKKRDWRPTGRVQQKETDRSNHREERIQENPRAPPQRHTVEVGEPQNSRCQIFREADKLHFGNVTSAFGVRAGTRKNGETCHNGFTRNPFSVKVINKMLGGFEI
jgi:hypothetical protein